MKELAITTILFICLLGISHGPRINDPLGGSEKSSAISVTGAANSQLLQSQQNNAQNSSRLIWIVVIVSGVVGYGGVKVAKYMLKTKCPNCHKWRTSRIIESKTIDSREYCKIVTRFDAYFDFFGNEIEGPGRKIIVCTGFIVDLAEIRECSNCNHQWKTMHRNST